MRYRLGFFTVCTGIVLVCASPVANAIDAATGAAAFIEGFTKSLQESMQQDAEDRRQRKLLEYEYELKRQQMAEQQRLFEERQRLIAEQQRQREQQIAKERQEEIDRQEAAKKIAEEESRRQGVTGSGFVVAPGYVITNAHVVGDFSNVAVRNRLGESYQAKVVYKNAANDVAVLSVPVKNVGLRIVQNSGVTKGQPVYAIGYPVPLIQGTESKITEGIISSFSGLRDNDQWFQISAPVQGGNSGGPLINKRGEVVGMVVASVSARRMLQIGADLPQNVNYAIKPDILLAALKEAGIKLPVVHKKEKQSLDYADQHTVLILAKDESMAEESARVEKRRQAVSRPEAVAANTLTRFKGCGDDSCPEMVVIPAGTHTLFGDRLNGATVYIPRFALGKTLVTQGQWKAIMGSNPSKFSNCGDSCPVENVSWNDTQEYLRRLSKKAGRAYRLPSEAEWEYACMAGQEAEYCGGSDLDSVAWYGGNSGKTTRPVAGKQANGFGLHDMSGNVWELLQDCWGNDCLLRVVRGGSWEDGPQDLRAALRWGTALRGNVTGFRIARTAP